MVLEKWYSYDSIQNVVFFFSDLFLFVGFFFFHAFYVFSAHPLSERHCRKMDIAAEGMNKEGY